MAKKKTNPSIYKKGVANNPNVLYGTPKAFFKGKGKAKVNFSPGKFKVQHKG